MSGRRADAAVGLEPSGPSPVPEASWRWADKQIGTADVTNLRDLISARAALGDKPLIHIGEDKLTYGEADKLSTSLARGLVDLGVSPGDTVATLIPNAIDHIVVWFACAKLGAIWAPVNVSLVGQDLVRTLNDTEARVVFVGETGVSAYTEIRSDLEHLRCEVSCAGAAFDADAELSARGIAHLSLADLTKSDAQLPEVDIQPGTPAAIIYTGGSTGLPKGVLVPQFYYITASLRWREIASATSSDVSLGFGQLYHASGQQTGLICPMFCGMTAVMFPRFSASEYWELVRRYGVTIIDPITPLLAMLMKKPPSADDRVHSVRTAVAVGTASLSPDDRDGFEERFGIPLHEVYGQTELAVCAVSERPDDRRKGSAGRSYGWFDISIRGEDDVALPPGAQGEIALRPRYPHTMMAQYWKRPEATVASWRNLWYHTGDVGSMDEDGYLYFGGRLAYWMRVRGENVSAYEVEMTIRQLESIDDVAVVGVPAELGDEDVKAYVIPTDPAAFEPTEVVSWCEQQLARYKVPRYIEVVGSFPRTAAKAEVERSTLRARGIGDAWDALDAAETAPSKRG